MFDDQLRATLAGSLQAAHKKFAQVGRARIAMQQGDPALAAASKASGGRIGNIAQLRNDSFDELFRSGGDLWFVVDHSGYGHRRHTGGARDVRDGYTASAAPRSTLFWCVGTLNHCRNAIHHLTRIAQAGCTKIHVSAK